MCAYMYFNKEIDNAKYSLRCFMVLFTRSLCTLRHLTIFIFPAYILFDLQGSHQSNNNNNNNNHQMQTLTFLVAPPQQTILLNPSSLPSSSYPLVSLKNS